LLIISTKPRDVYRWSRQALELQNYLLRARTLTNDRPRNTLASAHVDRPTSGQMTAPTRLCEIRVDAEGFQRRQGVTGDLYHHHRRQLVEFHISRIFDLRLRRRLKANGQKRH